MAVTQVVDVGTPPSGFQRWMPVEVDFHGFAELPTEKGKEVESPEFTCLENRWCLDIYPGGDETSADGMVDIYLSNRSNGSIEIEYCFIIRDSSNKEVVYYDFGSQLFAPKDDADDNDGVGVDVAKRSTLVKALVNGTLTIEVRMRKYDQTNTVPFIPKNPIGKNILEKFMDKESADVVFEVGGGSQQGGNTRKKTKITPTKFYAHHLILQDGAPMLAELCKTGRLPNFSDVITVSITDVKPDIFENILYYAYGGELSFYEDLGTDTTDLIDAADKYGVVSLKLEAEEYYVRTTKLTIDNMLDNLLYADSKNCAYLKEAVMDFMVENGDDIIGKVSFDNFPGHLVTDLLTAVTRGKKKYSTIGDTPDYNKMRVGTLRKMLDDKGLDFDGSREAMIALLKAKDKEAKEKKEKVEESSRV